MQVVDHDEVWERLPMSAAIGALQAAIATDRLGTSPPRQHLHAGDQELLLMPSFLDGGAGVKLVGIDPDNPARGLPRIQGVFVLFDPPGLTPAAVVDARALTALRTAAVSGLATRYLARPDASRLVIFGAGPQAHAHLLAMHALFALSEVAVVSRTREAAELLVARAREELGLAAVVAGPDTVADADVICACTTSRSPVFDGALLPEGVHVNAVGAYRPDMQEVDATTVTGSAVVVESREAALAESGDLIVAERDAGWDPAAIAADLVEVVRDGVAVRTTASQRTLFESVGVAFEDLVIARAVLDAADSGR
jgi:ornithine cyclodeaminase/alanine dehydrogenase-like protein (mu-crystallin family)